MFLSQELRNGSIDINFIPVFVLVFISAVKEWQNDINFIPVFVFVFISTVKVEK